MAAPGTRAADVAEEQAIREAARRKVEESGTAALLSSSTEPSDADYRSEYLATFDVFLHRYLPDLEQGDYVISSMKDVIRQKFCDTDADAWYQMAVDNPGCLLYTSPSPRD